MREEIKANILKRIYSLQEGYRHNIGVVGPFGIGKTTLLHQLRRELSEQPSFVSIYVSVPSLDFQEFSEKWINSLLTSLFASRKVPCPTSLISLIEAAAPVVPKTVEKIIHVQKLVGRDKSFAVARELFALTGIMSEETGKKIVLMLDEFHALSTVIEGDVFALLGREIMMEKKTLYLLSSSQPRQAAEIFRDKLSLLFSNFEIFTVPPMTASESRQFFQNHTASSALPDEARTFLISLTQGIPLYLEILMNRFSEIFSSYVASREMFTQYSDNDQPLQFLLKACTEEIVDSRGRLSLFFEKKLEMQLRSTKEYIVGLKLLVELSRSHRKASEIASVMNKKIQDVKKHLLRFEEEGVIERNGTFSYIPDNLYQFWLSKVISNRFKENSLSDETLFVNPGLMDMEYKSFLVSTRISPDQWLEELFKSFHNDSVLLREKKYALPLFSDITTQQTELGGILIAKCKEVRWGCQTSLRFVEEKDVTSFMLKLKSSKRKFQKKILLALSGVEQNAKLLAHELKIQIWDLKDFNDLRALYHLPPVAMPLDEDKTINETFVGALAQSVYTA